MSCCPTCGQRIQADDRVRIDLDNGIAYFRSVAVKLSERESEIAHVIVSCAPERASTSTIVTRVYGLTETEWSATATRVAIQKLRRKMASIGVDLNNSHGYGYAFFPMGDAKRIAS